MMRFGRHPRVNAYEDLALERASLLSEQRRSNGWLGLCTRWLTRPLILGTAVPLVLLATTATLAPWYWQLRDTASGSVSNSRRVITGLDQLKMDISSLTVKWCESLAYADSSHVKPFEERVRQQANVIQTLVRGDELQSLSAVTLRDELSAMLRVMDDIVGASPSPTLGAASPFIRKVEEIGLQVDRMRVRERVLLVDQSKRIDALERSKTWFVSVAVTGSTVFAGIATALAWHEARRRQAATEENVKLHNGLEQREAKIRRLLDANIVGIFICDFEGAIFDANDAFLRMVGYNREDIDSGRLRWTDLTPPEWHHVDVQAVQEHRMTGHLTPREKEYYRKDGSRLPVLIGATNFDESENQIVFVVDLTEQKRAEESLHKIQMELAHANRVATMGHLTASIAHEIRQPLTATVTNAQAALRWLRKQPPDLEEVQQALGRILETGHRAGDVVAQIRALIQKAPPRKDRVDLNAAIREVIELTRGEAVKNGISMRLQLADGLPLIHGDRIQLQQVLLNLVINAVEAMSSVSEGARDLLISSAEAESDGVLVAVMDSGPGLDLSSLDRLFDAFYTTKPGGLGMGLSICRSIIDTHGGRLWASAHVPQGAIFQFVLPAHPGSAS